MAHLAKSIAPALLASLVVTLAAVGARAETPAASATPDCLAKPNGPSAKGKHWYYRVERASGRHCWYQHAIDAAKAPKNVPAQPHVVAEKAAPSPRAAASAAELPPMTEASAAPTPPTADNDENNLVPPVSAPVAAPANAPVAWPPTAAVTAAPPAEALPALPTAAPAAPLAAAVPADRLPMRSV